MANFTPCLKLLLSGFEKFYAHEGQGRKKGISDIFTGRGWRTREAAISAGGLFVSLSSAAVAVGVFIRPFVRRALRIYYFFLREMRTLRLR